MDAKDFLVAVNAAGPSTPLAVTFAWRPESARLVYLLYSVHCGPASGVSVHEDDRANAEAIAHERAFNMSGRTIRFLGLRNVSERFLEECAPHIEQVA